MATKNSSISPTSDPGVESVTASLRQVAFVDPHPHPALRQASSFTPPLSRPSRGGLANRRLRPGFKLSDIDRSFSQPPPRGAGSMNTGVAPERPFVGAQPQRRPPSSTESPFSNFGKIVFVPSAPLSYPYSALLQRSFRRAEFQRQSCITLRRRRLFERILFLDQHGATTTQRRTGKRELWYCQESPS
jgi:hypothetical protein